MKKILILISILFIATVATDGKATKETTVKELLGRMDLIYRSNNAWAEMEMRVETPHWKRTMKMEMWTKGLKNTFIRILAPKKDRGIATLRKDNDMWNYFPKINKVIKIPPSMRMGSWMGSDFTNDDLVKETTFIDDYHSKMVKLNDKKIYHIELRPKDGTVSVWGKIVMRIERKRLLPISYDYYNEKGEMSRTMTFRDVKRIGGRIIPATMELIPISAKKKGHRTVVTYLRAKFDKGVSKRIFTRKNLQKRR